jgi:hypothetical protein
MTNTKTNNKFQVIIVASFLLLPKYVCINIEKHTKHTNNKSMPPWTNLSLVLSDYCYLFCELHNNFLNTTCHSSATFEIIVFTFFQGISTYVSFEMFYVNIQAKNE